MHKPYMSMCQPQPESRPVTSDRALSITFLLMAFATSNTTNAWYCTQCLLNKAQARKNHIYLVSCICGCPVLQSTRMNVTWVYNTGCKEEKKKQKRPHFYSLMKIRLAYFQALESAHNYFHKPKRSIKLLFEMTESVFD